MITPAFSRTVWRKSSHSGNGGECVEAAVLNEAVGVRDSKDPHGPILVLDRQGWTSLLAVLKISAAS